MSEKVEQLTIRRRGDDISIDAYDLDQNEIRVMLGEALVKQLADAHWYVIRTFLQSIERNAVALGFQNQEDAKAGRELTGEELADRWECIALERRGYSEREIAEHERIVALIAEIEALEHGEEKS